MDNFIDQLNGLCVQSEKLIPTTKQKAKMTAAGAEVYEKALKSNTPRSDHDDKKAPHLQDAITSQNMDINGEENGNSIVGFAKKAYIARFLNDGTKKMKATHFVDNTRKQTEEDVFKAERTIYDQLIKGDNK
ncbi:HK97-gp10 family putative phage morphogenesis protein [Melissococcus plutonius]|uniref:HK97-gp10 family putative phage morphogenesis protein n=1 Tax=Melissococcus plutonius TaxID=33970 RepID=UPI003C2E2AB5